MQKPCLQEAVRGGGGEAPQREHICSVIVRWPERSQRETSHPRSRPLGESWRRRHGHAPSSTPEAHTQLAQAVASFRDE